MGMYGRHLGQDGKELPRRGTDVNTGEGLTKQAFANEVDINKIVAGFDKTGMITHLNKNEPFYGDVSGIRSYQESMAVVAEAQELFFGLDAKLRERFSNDPAQLIQFLDNPENAKEALEIGLIVRRPDPEPGFKDVVTGLKEVTDAVKLAKKGKTLKEEE